MKERKNYGWMNELTERRVEERADGRRVRWIDGLFLGCENHELVSHTPI